MADKEKQIEEMTKDLCDIDCKGMKCNVCDSYGCEYRMQAEALYNEGWRKQSEVIDEFAEKLKEAPIKCGLPLLGLSIKEEIEEYFNGIMLQVRDAIDNIVKEMKGGV